MNGAVPAINVRFTDEQHRELFDAAHENRRSMQREILARLFGNGALEGRGGATRRDSADGLAAGIADTPAGDGSALGSRSLDAPRPSSVSIEPTKRSFRPDPKGGKKR